MASSRRGRMGWPSTDRAPGGGAGLTGQENRWSRIGTAILGALMGGLIGGALVVAVTLVLKAGIDFGARQDVWYVLLVPVLGLAIATLALHGFGRGATDGRPTTNPWRTFPPDAVRADISS